MQMINSGQLAQRIVSERDPRALSALLNNAKFARIGVHPFYHRIMRPEGGGQKTREKMEYERRVVSLFEDSRDYEMAFMLFEDTAAEGNAKRAFADHGGKYKFELPPLLSPWGRVFLSEEERKICNRDWLRKIIKQNEKSGAHEKLRALLRKSEGVFVFGMQLDECVKRAVVDIEKLLGEIGKQAPIAINGLFVRK